ncbi:aminotransferase [Nonomuraea monospora]|uniref:Aminotransferase n=1 Tax=Nonomuraea monospora TaxID=568818 RepID=A0ABP5PJB1_9ACTN
MSLMHLRPAALDDWLRDYYFTAEIDISSSGVEPYSMAELRALAGIGVDDLDNVMFRDSRSCGMAELRTAIADRFGYGDSSEVLVTHGSGEAEHLFMMTFFSPGDEVVVASPIYHTLGAMAASVGCRVVAWHLRHEDGFAVNTDDLRRLVSPRTRAVIVNLPHNPTGASVDTAAQQEIISIARGVGAYLVWDEVFRELTYDTAPLPSTTTLYERSVAFGSLSKAYGLPGLRIGWGVMPEELIGPCVTLRDHSTFALSPLVERIALAAVQRADVLLTPRYDQAYKNLSLLEDWMHRNEGLVEGVRPVGGVTAFPRLPEVPDVEEFCHRLLHEYGVLLLPGGCFGFPQHIRLGFGGPAEAFETGLARLTDLLLKTRQTRRPGW